MNNNSLDAMEERLTGLLARLRCDHLAELHFRDSTSTEIQERVCAMEWWGGALGDATLPSLRLAHEAALTERELLRRMLGAGISLGSADEPTHDWERARHHGLVS